MNRLLNRLLGRLPGRPHRSLQRNQAGLVPLLILILLVVAALVYLAYSRVLHAQQ